MTTIGIYKITCTNNGYVYIGSSCEIDVRLVHHKSDLNLGYHRNVFLQNCYNKYGKDSFLYEVIQPVINVENLLEIEEKWISIYSKTHKCMNIRLNPTKPSSADEFK